MEILKQLWDKLSSVFNWLFVVLPWEQGIRIWMGREEQILGPGIHYKVPFLHTAYKQHVRLDFISMSPQTLTTKSGETLTLSIMVGYVVDDISKLYNSVTEISGALTGFVSSRVAAFVSSRFLYECKPQDIEDHIRSQFMETEWGITIKEIGIRSYAVVKTYRLIQDGQWVDKSPELTKSI